MPAAGGPAAGGPPASAGVADAAEDPREPERTTIAAAPTHEHRLRREQHSYRAKAVRAERTATRHEIDDRIREAEPRRDFHGARDLDELDGDAELGEEPAAQARVHRRSAEAIEVVGRLRWR